MNDRIREIERQCWSHTINGTLIDGHLHFDYCKFAEMIVRECITICEEGKTTQMTSSGAADKIRMKFGVK